MNSLSLTRAKGSWLTEQDDRPCHGLRRKVETKDRFVEAKRVHHRGVDGRVFILVGEEPCCLCRRLFFAELARVRQREVISRRSNRRRFGVTDVALESTVVVDGMRRFAFPLLRHAGEAQLTSFLPAIERRRGRQRFGLVAHGLEESSTPLLETVRRDQTGKAGIRVCLRGILAVGLPPADGVVVHLHWIVLACNDAKNVATLKVQA